MVRPVALTSAVVNACGLDAAMVSNVGRSVLAAAAVVDVNAANVGAELMVDSARVVRSVVVLMVLGVVVSRPVALGEGSAMYG